MPKKLGIIIPVYNEEDNISQTIQAIKAKVHTPYVIYIVYDFDEDNTLPVLKRIRKEGVDLVLLKNSAGKVVNAIKKGLREAESKYLLVTMADLSDDYDIVDQMVSLAETGFDVVCGSRYSRGGKQIGGPLVKKTLSHMAGLSLRYMAGVPTSDVTNNFKLYRKAMVDTLKIESDGGFEIAMEIVIKAHFAGHKVTEIPCTWRDRQKGTSRFRILRWLPKYMKWYLFAVKKRAKG
ncbi:MAG: glycosyltransferase family 2 protein [Deltaproteobacteria bacterium]|nr:glycosyltransferase family 2 protein [Deltaproteobacteria bacterium]